MTFHPWLAEAAAELQRKFQLGETSIPRKWWSEAYIAGATPSDAADTVAGRYINRLPHAARLRFQMTRNGRTLTEADERAIRRTVRRKGR